MLRRLKDKLDQAQQSLNEAEQRKTAAEDLNSSFTNKIKKITQDIKTISKEPVSKENADKLKDLEDLKIINETYLNNLEPIIQEHQLIQEHQRLKQITDGHKQEYDRAKQMQLGFINAI